jgi:hypothetical protein
MNATDVSGVADGARRRHPCMRSPIRPSALHERFTDLLELHGARHPEVAAAVLAVRGAAGADQETFARRAGVDLETLRRAEAGDLARSQLPGALRRMVPHGSMG